MLKINFDPFPLIKTERLVLRQLAEEDVNEIFFLRSDKRVMKYLDRPAAQSIEEALQFIQKTDDLKKGNEAVTWGITLKEDPKLIGTICIWNIIREHHRGEIGYALHPHHQGKGIMQEALTAVLNYGFSILHLHSVEANVNPGNKPSIRLLERNKFKREAYFRENYFYNDKFIDTAIYSLLTTIDR